MLAEAMQLLNRIELIPDGIGKPFDFSAWSFLGRVLVLGTGGEVIWIKNRDDVKVSMLDFKTH